MCVMLVFTGEKVPQLHVTFSSHMCYVNVQEVVPSSTVQNAKTVELASV